MTESERRAEKVKQILKERNITIKTLAQAMGVNETLVSKFLRCQVLFTDNKARAVAYVLDIDEKELLGDAKIEGTYSIDERDMVKVSEVKPPVKTARNTKGGTFTVDFLKAWDRMHDRLHPPKEGNDYHWDFMDKTRCEAPAKALKALKEGERVTKATQEIAYEEVENA